MSAPPLSPKPSQGTLGKRLLATFAVVLTLTLVGSLIGIWSLRQLQQSSSFTTHALPSWASACRWPKTAPCWTASMPQEKTF